MADSSIAGGSFTVAAALPAAAGAVGAAGFPAGGGAAGGAPVAAAPGGFAGEGGVCVAVAPVAGSLAGLLCGPELQDAATRTETSNRFIRVSGVGSAAGYGRDACLFPGRACASIQSSTVWYQSWLFLGLRTQWPSSGK